MWLEGGYNRPWKVARRKEGCISVEWTDTAPKTAVILYDFELTPRDRLRKATMKHLKDAYSKLDS